MPVPSSINDLSTTAASNSPGGGEAPTTADDYIRAHASFIATLRDGKVDKAGTVTPTANQPMGGYKHTGAGTATAAGDYVVWNQAGVKFPALGIGTASSTWSGSNIYAVDIGPRGALHSNTAGVDLLANSYFDGTNYRAKETAGGAIVDTANEGIFFYTMASVSAGAVQTAVLRAKIDPSGIWGVGTNLTALDATQLTTGTVPSARMSGTYGISISGNAATATSATSATTATAATDYKSRALSSATRSSGIGEATTYSSEVYDTASNFDPTTGRFTAPATGVYLVTWTAQANAGGGSAVAAFARVNGSAPNLGSVVAITGTTVAGAVAVPLTAGQYVSIWMSVSGGLDCLINEFQVNRIA